MSVLKFDNADKYFKNFLSSNFNSGYILLQSYLNRFNDHYNKAVNLSPDSPLRNDISQFNETAEFKKGTYYNVKRIHDELVSTRLDRRSDILSITKPSEISNINVDNLMNSKLFYNSKLKSDICKDDIKSSEGNHVNREYDIYQIFQVLDRGGNDIGNRILADLVYLHENLGSDFVGGENDPVLGIISQKSIFTIISGLARTNGFILQQLPNYLNINSAISEENANNSELISEIVNQQFGVHTTTKLLGEDITLGKGENKRVFGGIIGFPGYIFQLGTIHSTLSDQNKISKNNLTDSFCMDIGVDESNNKKSLVENAPKDILNSSLVTSFSVDFGKKNQQMFNNIELDTAQFADTEHSLQAWTEMVNESRKTGQSQNIFPVMEKYMYTCEVSGLGNATIQPLTYFYLRNVPMFSGTYWITNVKHNIVPNNMTTTLKGVRQPIVTKNDSRKTLLKYFKDINKSLRDKVYEQGSTVDENIPLTGTNRIRKVNNNTLYGGVEQLIVGSNNNFYLFDGQSIIGNYITAITNDNTISNSVIGLISYLYNTSKRHTYSNSHFSIINNMVNIVISDLKIRQKYGETLFTDNKIAGSISLSKLFNNNPTPFNVNSEINKLLNDIAHSESKYNELISIEQTSDVYGLRLLSNNKIESVQLQSTINLGSDIKLVDFYLDKNLKYNINTQYHDNFIGYDLPLINIFNVFDGNVINTFDKKYFDNNKYVKFLGCHESNKISFFNLQGLMSNNNNSFIDLSDTPSSNNSNRTFVSNAIREYNNWNNGTLLETDPKALQFLNKYWLASGYQPNDPVNEAWSAAFISYITNSELSSHRHSTYIHKVFKNEIDGWNFYLPQDLDNLEIGDIICLPRGTSTPDINLIRSGEFYRSHADIIVNLNNNSLDYIGGNLGNSVKKIRLNLINNKLPNNYFAVLRKNFNQQSRDIQSIQPSLSSNMLNKYNIAESESVGFKNKVKLVASNIGVHEYDLVRVMYKESAGTFSPSILLGGKDYFEYDKSDKDDKPLGLIQFTNVAVADLNTRFRLNLTKNMLANMDRIRQLDIVQKYYERWNFKPNVTRNVSDLYLATFYPAAIGKPRDFVLGNNDPNSSLNKFRLPITNPAVSRFSNTFIDGKKVLTVDSVIKFVNSE